MIKSTKTASWERWILVSCIALAFVCTLLCAYGYAAMSTDLLVSGEATVLAQARQLVYAPMDGIGEANSNYVPTPAPFLNNVTGSKFSVTGSITHSTEKVKIGQQSGYFGGEAPQRLSASIPSLNFGTKDFTISLWAYPEVQTKLFPVLISDTYNGNIQFFISDNNAKKAISLSAGALRFLPTTTFYTPNVWTHYAVVRKNGAFTIYKDGVNIGSTTIQRSFSISTFSIGGNSSVNTPFLGYMDDIAIYDYAKWDNDFTPPTEPQTDANLVYVDFEEELIDDTIYNSQPVIEEVSGKYFTTQGTGAIRGTEDSEASGGTALYFEGVAGQRLTLDNDNLNFGTKDFTVSFWLKPSAQTMTTPIVFGNEDNSGLRFYLSHNSASNRIALYNASTVLINTGRSFSPNVWTHYAITRHNGVFTIYQNGVAIGSTSSYTSLNVDLSKLAIGGNSVTATTAYKGYIDDFVIYDRSIYDGNFTPQPRS